MRILIALAVLLACSATVMALADVVDLTATGQNRQIAIRWETAAEMSLAGFNLYRRQAVGGQALDLVRVNAELIPSVGGDMAGAEYELVDVGLVPGRRYTYWLESVDLDGSTAWCGSVSAMTRAIAVLP